VSQRPDWTTITTKKGGGLTCFAYYDKAATVGLITGGVLAAVVIGAVVVAALVSAAAGKAYLYMQMKQGGMGPAQGNPLYENANRGGENPLFKS
jgi:hypothetical protein